MHEAFCVNVLEPQEHVAHDRSYDNRIHGLALLTMRGEKVIQVAVWHELADKVEPVGVVSMNLVDLYEMATVATERRNRLHLSLLRDYAPVVTSRFHTLDSILTIEQ